MTALLTVTGSRRLEFWPQTSVAQTPPPSPGKVVEIYGPSVEEPERWSLDWADPSTYAPLLGLPPLVAEVTLHDTVKGRASVYTDAVLLPDIAYRLTVTAYGSTQEVIFTGRRGSGRDVDGAEQEPLLDIDVPLIRDGQRGAYTRAGSGDYARTGGVATVEKLIWHRLLVERGTWSWAPDFGSILRLKELRPREIRDEERKLQRVIETVLGVRSAVVSLTTEDDQVRVSVRAQTDFGELVTTGPLVTYGGGGGEIEG